MSKEGKLSPAIKGSGELKNKVAILDAGAQYGKVIDRRVRNLLVRSEILPLDTPLKELEGYGAIIISGGPDSVYSPNSPKPDPNLFKFKKPLLGICYGMQLINQAYKGTVEKKATREDGQFEIEVDPSTPFFNGLDTRQSVLMSHGDSLGLIAPGFRVVAKSNDIVAAIADDKRKIYGVQFHPEVDLTDNGVEMLSNFLFKIAGLRKTYTLEDKLEESIKYIREAVGKRQVLAFVSGGVDSTVLAVLLSKALPANQVHVVHVDTGFMRKDESSGVEKALRKIGINMLVIDAAKQFYSARTEIDGIKIPPLSKVTDPELKRRIIGDTFVKVMERVIDNLKLNPANTVLAQGTLRPDLIESASKLASSKAAVIKTHHNDTELVRQLRNDGRVIEPLQQLHKDEVRQLGEKLGLPTDLVWRQPFPGPGLAIRLLCSTEPYITDDFEDIVKLLKEFEDNEIKVHLLPVRTVGVQGDGRSYSYLVGLSGAADWPKLIGKAREIPKRIHSVNRVVYIFGGTIRQSPLGITPTFPSIDAIEQLRAADARVNAVLSKHGLNKRISQVPVVSFPLNFGIEGNRSIGIRPFITNDFMTGAPAIPGVNIDEAILNEIVDEVLSVPGISKVVYDLTSKPPGTTEWE